MTDSLKFGPEWLRTCSSTSTNSVPATTNSAPRYPLSEFRYGREEMLALFDKNIKDPEILPRYKNLFMEKIQCPLALTPSAEDEQVQARMWPMRSSPGLSVRGGRGGIMDRGRGRGRGTYHSVGGGYPRTSLFDEENGGRTMGGRGERWVERNGTDPNDWGSGGLQATSPRKEYSSHGRGTSIESWRRPRTDEDAPLEQWRSGSLGPREPTKWGRSTSWREEDSTLAESRVYGNDRGYNGALDRAGGMPNRALGRRPWEVPEDNLPEWAVENPLESGGSFDATGAFHGSDDELCPENSSRLDKHNFMGKANRGGMKDMNGSNDEELERPNNRIRSETDKELPADGGMTMDRGELNDDANASEQISTTATAPQRSAVNPSEVQAKISAGQGLGRSVDRMQEVADDMVEKLIMDDEMMLGQREKPMTKMGDDSKMGPGMMVGQQKGAATATAAANLNDTEWFYRDPQDMVQGPFSSVEMAEWYQAGYFDNNLCVRRKNDQRFSKLGDLIEMCGGEMPFFVPYRALPMQLNAPLVDAPTMKVPPMMPHRMNPAGMMDLDPSIDPRHLRQAYLARQHAIAFQKLSTSEMWHMLSPDQQRQMITKHVAQMPIPDSIYGLQAALAAGDSNHAPFGLFDQMNKPPPSLEGAAGVEGAMLQQLAAAKKMQRILPPGQGQGQQPSHMPMMPPIPQDFPPVLNAGDPLNQLMHNMRIFPQPNNAMPSMIGPQMPQPPTGSAAENDRIKSLLMQLSMQKGMQPQQGPGASAALNQMMMSHQQQQQQHLQKPGMVPWPFDPLKGQPGGGGGAGGGGGMNMNAPNAGNNWMGMDVNQGGPNGGPAMEMNRPNNAGPAPIISGGGIWELEHKLFNNNSAKPIEMKTEKQIIEEQQMAMLQKEKEADEQQQQMNHQQMHSEQMNQQMRESNDKQGWTKVESKAAVGKVEANLKDKKSYAAELGDKNAKKKEAVKPGQAQKKEETPKKVEGKQKEAAAAANQKGKPDNKGTPTAGNNKSQSAKGVNNGNAKSVAPWSINQPVEAPGLSLAEIQKLELEQQRAEQSRMDQILQQQQQQWFDIQNLKADLPKWNAPQIAPSVVKSLAEIQAEEQAKLRQWQESASAQAASTAAAATQQAQAAKKVAEEAAGPVWGSMKTWSSNGQAPSSMAGFWEEPVKSVANSQAQMSGATARAVTGGKTISKSQTMSNIQAKAPANLQAAASMAKAGPVAQKGKTNAVAAASTNGNVAKGAASKGGKANKKDDAGQEFTQWCTKALSAYNSTIDIPTFVSFLQDIESPYEVKDYIRVYLGETKECTDFCKQFLERRSKYKNQIRAANAHVDDMCSPAPALTPSSDFQEVKGKAKKVKKNKMMKLDSRILGFSVTAAQDRINVGDRDYPNAS